MNEVSSGNGTAATLPHVYITWRNSRLGRITDTLEQQLIFGMIGPAAGLRALDAGCGDGQLTAALSKGGAHVTAIDKDPNMLAAATRRFKDKGVDVDLINADIEAIPFTSGSFDLVIAVTVLCFFPDAGRAIREMARVLRPGGRLFIGELHKFSTWAALRRIRGWFGHKVWRTARFRTVSELSVLVSAADLDVRSVRGAVFYPPCGRVAAVLAPLDEWLGRRVVFGGAFLALSAVKSMKCDT